MIEKPSVLQIHSGRPVGLVGDRFVKVTAVSETPTPASAKWRGCATDKRVPIL
jgi:hypothetical protein